MSHCECNKVLFAGSSAAQQLVPAGGIVGFEKNMASNVTYSSNSVTIKRAGVYLINVSASATLVNNQLPGYITIQLQNNGSNVDGAASSTAYSGTNVDTVNMSFSTIVRVDPTQCPVNDKSATLTIVNTQLEATYSKVSITVVRI